MACQDKKAIFPGSFDPFHFGHLYLLYLAQKKFKEIIICISVNPKKINQTPLCIRQQQVLNFLQEHQIKATIIINELSTATICNELNIYNIIRGYRNKVDKNYELAYKKALLKANNKIKFHLFKGKRFLDFHSSKIKKK